MAAGPFCNLQWDSQHHTESKLPLFNLSPLFPIALVLLQALSSYPSLCWYCLSATLCAQAVD